MTLVIINATNAIYGILCPTLITGTKVTAVVVHTHMFASTIICRAFVVIDARRPVATEFITSQTRALEAAICVDTRMLTIVLACLTLVNVTT